MRKVVLRIALCSLTLGLSAVRAQPEPAPEPELPVFALAPQAPQPAAAPHPGGLGPKPGKPRSDERSYSVAMRALEAREWARAAEQFTQVAAAGGPRAEGALYWKAYALHKLGRRDEALVARESNPDLQQKAVHYLGIIGGAENRQLLADLAVVA